MSEIVTRDDLVRKFAYEYVHFNHDQSTAYLVTDVTDDCMIELEGMSGLFAPDLFKLVPKANAAKTAAERVRSDWGIMSRLEQIRSRHQLWDESDLPNSEYSASWQDVKELLDAISAQPQGAGRLFGKPNTEAGRV